MRKSQTKKAIQARKWRDNARNQRQLNNVIAIYVQHKYMSIYNECHELYLSLKNKYPDLGPKCILTKTPMFRRLIDDMNSSDNEEKEKIMTRSKRKTAGYKVSETVSKNPQHSDSETTAVVNPVSPPAPQHQQSSDSETDAVVNPVSPPAPQQQQSSDSETDAVVNPVSPPAPQQQQSSDSETDAVVNPVSPPAPQQQQSSDSETAATVSPPVSRHQQHSETAAAANPAVQAPTIPVYHLHVGYNALGEMVDQLTNEGEYVNINNVNNDFFMDVINELEQDDELHQLLNNVEVQPLEDPVDMDEGIGLGIADEDDDFNFLRNF